MEKLYKNKSWLELQISEGLSVEIIAIISNTKKATIYRYLQKYQIKPPPIVKYETSVELFSKYNYRRDNRVREKVTRTYFEFMFKEKFPSFYPDWLRNQKGNKMQLDGFCKELGLAFEYNGPHHYSFLAYTNMITKETKMKALEERKRDDNLKKELCKKNNVVLIEIPYTIDFKDLQMYILEKCREKGFNLENVEFLDYKTLITNFSSYFKLRKNRVKNCTIEFKCMNFERLNRICKNGHPIWLTKSQLSIKNCPWCGIEI